MDIPGLGAIRRKVESRGELLFLGLAGSHAYGLNHEDSDFDIQGVYRAPTAQVLQIWGRPKETLHEANVKCPECLGHEKDVPFVGAYGSGTAVCPTCGDRGELPDYTAHELGKFFNLAASANPTVLEVMYLEPIVSSPAWNLIVENRDAFLSTAVRRTYGGYAKQQLHKKEVREAAGMEGYSPKTRYRDSKHTRHIVRLFLQERQILETGSIDPVLSEEHKSLCLEAQDWDSETLKSWMDAQTLELLEINSSIPPTPDYERINNLLLSLRGY